MKIRIEGKLFKEAVDRAIPLVKGRSILSLMESVKLFADDSGAYLYVTNGIYAMKITLEAQVIEQGEVYVHLDNLKKVYAMPGTLLIETGKTFSVRNGKKRSDVAVFDHDHDLASLFAGSTKEEKDNGQLFCVMPDALLRMLRAVDCARSCVQEENSRQVLNGFNFNGAQMKLYAMDGYRLHAVKLAVDEPDNDALSGFNRVVHGDMFAHLKKAVKGACAKFPLRVHDFGTYMKVVGWDFEYSACYVPGDPLNVEKIIPTQPDAQYVFSAKELHEIVKGYKANCTSSRDDDGENAMYMLCVGDELRTGMMTADIHTMDALESYAPRYGMSEKYFHGFAVHYMLDSLCAIREFADEDEITASCKNNYNIMTHCNVHPLLLCSGDLSCLVLPLRVKEERVAAITGFMSGAM